MTRERLNKLLPALNFWAAGGDLWWYNGDEWYKYAIDEELFVDTIKSETDYIIGDKHLLARQAYALGKPVEFKDSNNIWTRCEVKPFWKDTVSYRPAKPQWYELEENIDKVIMVRNLDTEEWVTDKFKSYEIEGEFPFITDTSNYKQARLLTPDDLAKEAE